MKRKHKATATAIRAKSYPPRGSMARDSTDNSSEIKGRPWSKTAIEKVLLTIIKRRVITESELLKFLGGTSNVKVLNGIYKRLVGVGFPIKRCYLMGGSPYKSSHRVIIYYLGGEA